jgi:hypothetical protein
MGLKRLDMAMGWDCFAITALSILAYVWILDRLIAAHKLVPSESLSDLLDKTSYIAENRKSLFARCAFGVVLVAKVFRKPGTLGYAVPIGMVLTIFPVAYCSPSAVQIIQSLKEFLLVICDFLRDMFSRQGKPPHK